MSQHLERFLRDRPDLSLVQDSEHMDLLLWAHKKRYISLCSAPSGPLCFTQKDLEKAQMWWDKVGEEDGR